MKKTRFRILIIPTIFIAAVSFNACKGKSADKAATDTATMVVPPAAMPDTAAIQIAGDDSLTMKIKDAIKDFPTVSATSIHGIITLTGDISREKVPRLMMALNAMHPKKVNNNLTIK